MIESSKAGYPELEEKKEFIFRVLTNEENQFNKTIDQGLRILSDMEEDMKKALLVVSFGTSYHDTREKNIAACERDLAASCPDRTLFRAFTSGMIIRKLQQRDGIHIDTPLQARQSPHPDR